MQQSPQRQSPWKITVDCSRTCKLRHNEKTSAKRSIANALEDGQAANGSDQTRLFSLVAKRMYDPIWFSRLNGRIERTGKLDFSLIFEGASGVHVTWLRSFKAHGQLSPLIFLKYDYIDIEQIRLRSDSFVRVEESYTIRRAYHRGHMIQASLNSVASIRHADTQPTRGSWLSGAPALSRSSNAQCPHASRYDRRVSTLYLENPNLDRDQARMDPCA